MLSFSGEIFLYIPGSTGFIIHTFLKGLLSNASPGFQLRKPCPWPIEKLNWYSSHCQLIHRLFVSGWDCPRRHREDVVTVPATILMLAETVDHRRREWRGLGGRRGRTLGVVNSHHSIDNGDESCCDTYQKWDGLISSCYDTRLRKVAICLESYSNFVICNFIFKWQVKIFVHFLMRQVCS